MFAIDSRLMRMGGGQKLARVHSHPCGLVCTPDYPAHLSRHEDSPLI